MIPIEPFEAEYEARDSTGNRVWMPCRVVGVVNGSTRYELLALLPFDDDMMCVMAFDDVRVKGTDKPADARSE
ncbi:hypothetical protein [Nitrobacter hamburgensis]|uniref:hypothetical protein n=1 Tax=Nitrobacter hamburgensis TaxID=912 RepID=UPI000303843E|nr:hypothetical protein [Nitrobacter hamburgensis]